MARSVAARYPLGLPYGLTEDDLIHEGWLAWHQHTARARTATFPYEKARFAMLEAVRHWRDSRSGGWADRRGETAAAVQPDDLQPTWNSTLPPVRRHRLRRGQINDLRAALHRLLTPRVALLCEQVLLDGVDLEEAARCAGYATLQQARVAKAKAYKTLATETAA